MNNAAWSRQPRRVRALASLGVWGVLALIAWLDSSSSALALRPGVELHTAHVFSFIIQGIGALAGFLGTGAAAAAGYLATALNWTIGRLGTFIKATGAVFAKSWDALKIVYADVLKPAVTWIDAHVKRLYSWLRTTFKPVFDFLYRVRAELLNLYKRFVRPILDVIDHVRVGLRILGTLGVDWARALDRRLGEWESVISDNFRRILSYVNEITDVVNAVVTPGRLFQQLPFVRSLDRDARYWIRIWWNKQIRVGPSGIADYERTRDYPARGAQEDINMLVDHFERGASSKEALFDEYVAIVMQTAAMTREPFGQESG